MSRYVRVVRGRRRGERATARAGGYGIDRAGTTITLDDSGSFDPDGDLVARSWTFVSVPASSNATLTPASPFVADVVGTYILELSVTDNAGAIARDQVTFMATALPVTQVIVNAGSDTTISWFAQGQVSGSVTASDGSTPTFSWTMTQRPFYSTATLANASTLTPSFVADAQGTYTLALTATAGGDTETDFVTVTASTVGQSFGGPDQLSPVAVAYSAALDRLIVLRRDPVSVSVVDPATGLGPNVVLPVQNQAPINIVLDPSGLRAAVANGEIAIVNLQPLSAEQVFENFSYNYRLAFAADNRVHSLPYDTNTNISSVDIATGTFVEVPSFTTNPGLAMHPAGAAMYLIDGSAAAIARYDLTSRPIALQRQAAVTSGYGVYITPNGSSLVTTTGIVLHATTNAATDMTFRGSLPTTNIEQVTQSPVTNEIATLSYPPGSVRLLNWYDGATLALRSSIPFVEPLTNNEYHGGYIAYRPDGRMYLVGWRANEWTVFTVTPPQ